jgi:hypothetical protein
MDMWGGPTAANFLSIWLRQQLTMLICGLGTVDARVCSLYMAGPTKAQCGLHRRRLFLAGSQKLVVS